MAGTPDLVDQFLQASLTAQRRRQRRSRLIVAAVLVTVSALAAAAGILAYRERQQRLATATQRDRALAAEQETAHQTIQLLAKTAEAEIDRNPARGVALALEALAYMSRYPDIDRVEPANALRRTLAAQPSLQALEPPSGSAYDLAFSPDGRWLVAAGVWGLARWQLQDPPGPLFGGPDRVEELGTMLALAFRPGAGPPLLAAGGRSGVVYVSDLQSPPVALPGRRLEVYSLAWSPNGSLLAAGHPHGQVQVWRQPAPGAGWDRPVLLEIPGEETYRPSPLAFSPDSNLLAAGGSQQVTLWPTAGLGQGLVPTAQAIPCEGNWADWLFWHSDTALATGYDRSLWDLETAAPSPACERVDDEIVQDLLTASGSFLAPSPSGRWLASAGGDNGLRLFYTEGGEVEHLRGHTYPIVSLAFSPDERLLASAAEDDTLRLWALAPEDREPRVYWDAADTLAFDPQGGLFVARGRGANVALSAMGDSPPVSRTLDVAEPSALHGLALGPRANWLVVTLWADDFTHGTALRLWDLASPAGTPVATLEGQAFDAQAVTADGSRAALGNVDGSIGLWDLAGQPSLRQTLPCVDETLCKVTGLAFDAQGRHLASWTPSGNLYVWDLASLEAGTRPLRFEGDWRRNLIAAGLSPDGRHLAAGYQAGNLQVWEVTDADSPPQELAGPQEAVTFLAFSPDGAHLAAAGASGTVYLWRLADPERAPQALEGPQGSPGSLAFSPDGRSLASVDGQGTVRVWRVSERDLIDFAMGRVQP